MTQGQGMTKAGVDAIDAQLADERVACALLHENAIHQPAATRAAEIAARADRAINAGARG